MRVLVLLCLFCGCAHLSGGERPSAWPGGSISCPQSHPIKGNADSMIYHMPGSVYYHDVIPEWCFQTESDARYAGYRRSRL